MRFLRHFRPFVGSFRACFLLVPLFALAAGQAWSQNGNPTVDPLKIVRDASYNELHSKSPGRSFRYRQHKVDPKGSVVKEIFETKDGDVARLIERDGKPLPPEEEQAEAHTTPSGGRRVGHVDVADRPDTHSTMGGPREQFAHRRQSPERCGCPIRARRGPGGSHSA